jgi:hypothetical protein
MQLPLSESAGREQVMKSALISSTALLPATPQSSGLAAIICSLIAKSA